MLLGEKGEPSPSITAPVGQKGEPGRRGPGGVQGVPGRQGSPGLFHSAFLSYIVFTMMYRIIMSTNTHRKSLVAFFIILYLILYSAKFLQKKSLFDACKLTYKIWFPNETGLMQPCKQRLLMSS